MQKSRYYPFERNRYFYGKLLTVRDFESEQKYFNDKRRLLNRLLYGAGVVSGMQVYRINDTQISVEMGVALDDQGREIVIPAPVTLKLSMVDGFTNNVYEKNVYLCVAYDEKDKEPVHSVANSTVRTDEASEYNRTFETYRLFVKEQAPSPTRFECSRLTHVTSVLYADDKVRVLQSTPRYVQAGDTFAVNITLEKTLESPPLSVNLTLDSTASAPLTAGNGNTVTFAEPSDVQEAVCRFSYMMQAGTTPGVEAKLVYQADAAKLSIGDKQVDLVPDVDNVVQIVADSADDHVLEDYFKRTLDDSLDASDDSCLYLAKINLKKNGPAFSIEEVERMPFGEYVYNSTALKKMGLLGTEAKAQAAAFSVTSSADLLPPDQKPQLNVEYDQKKQAFHFQMGIPQYKPEQEDHKIAMGIVTIPLKHSKSMLHIFSRLKTNFFSEEIEHGLGAGDVCVMAGLVHDSESVEDDHLKHGDCVFYGDQEVFAESPYDTNLPECALGTVVFSKKGTFCIGVKLKEETDRDALKVRWWAMRTLPVAEQTSAPAQEAAAGSQDA